ncbi:DDT domain-containing protein DDR4-like [Impatiens glandulifera]|uniref:DDT domain-containing protein DDR4-like n=1 Tax=Impatiens glandulifera TaxID=253017 RepID=UPI001FB10A11|nr:DDT domain-containing protein DDR4-like [Impatiens glandulifera]
MSSGEPSTSIHAGGSSPNEVTVEEEEEQEHSNHINNGEPTINNNPEKTTNNTSIINNSFLVRKERPSRACTARAQARVQAVVAADAAERKKKSVKKERFRGREESSSPPPPPQTPQCKIITPLLAEPPPSQQARWDLRSMWELASILNFMNVFRPLLNIKVEFSAEELETALIMPNSTLGAIHIPLLKAIPPITRMALGHNTWVTVLCRKLRDWWQWVAEGDIPIVASHGAEIDTYSALDPSIRVLILKALCDIRVEQEDIRNYIEDSIKHGAQLSSFRKERVGGDSYGISYWYEGDDIIGHRLYREIRKVEVKKGKGKSVPPIANSCYNWETVATNFDEFQDVSDKLFESKNRTEASLGKKLKIDMLPEIEKVHKRKEKLLKKQQRQALLLDNMMTTMDGFAAGRSLRDRKPVTYTFDDYDRSINEAIKITKRKQPSPEPTDRKEVGLKLDDSANGKWNNGPSQHPQLDSFEVPSPMSLDQDEVDEDIATETTDLSNQRRRQRPQRYSVKDYVDAISENEADFDSDDDIVGEAVYDEEYLRQRKQKKKISSSSEGDEEYHDEENADEEDDDEEEEPDNSLSISEDSDEPRRYRKHLPVRSTRREMKLKSFGGFQKTGLRRSRRSTRNRIDYKQYELSDSEAESTKPQKQNVSDEEFSEGNNEMEVDEPLPDQQTVITAGEEEEEGENKPLAKSSSSPDGDGSNRRFLDLNELAPGFGFDDVGPSLTKDEDKDNNL